jgi:uncharacterized CHY-type Zn-finger protein
METQEDNFDYATQCVFWAIKHLRNHLIALNDDDCADAIACYLALNELNSAVEIMSPSEGDWPAAKDGMGKILTFVPRRA